MIEQMRLEEQEAREAKKAANRPAGSSSSSSGTGGWRGGGQRRDESYWQYMQRQMQERTEKLGFAEDSMDRVEESSSGFLDDIDKFVRDQKKKAVLGGSKLVDGGVQERQQQQQPRIIVESEQDDIESPLDNSNFLSFEEWREQNLAKIGQSTDSVARNANRKDSRPRRPPNIRNNLESIGDEGEIDLDFGGFASEMAASSTWNRPRQTPAKENPANADLAHTSGADRQTDMEEHFQPGLTKRKNAGVTCKERSNYASFDCAATVLKTNRECSGSSAVLVENKDSYMLNECRAQNKFIILELCDDILIDTIVLANFEFFSSRFKTIKVSVSDIYPPKTDKWKELGVFEALNTREIQAFPVENPLIWARYVKIEFLTHYGNEFYCPLSLIRVHGTTMMEEFKSEVDNARSEDTIEEQEAIMSEMEPEGITVMDGKAENTTSANEEESFKQASVLEEIGIVLPESAA
ncbi:ATP-dependent DNA/RNA helicase, partial [Ascosphaera pollenicola]